MKTMLMFGAVAILFAVGVDVACASEDDGQSTTWSVSPMQAPRPPIAGGAARTFPLFTIGGPEVRVRAPVAPPYNADTNGNLAARGIWGAG